MKEASKRNFFWYFSFFYKLIGKGFIFVILLGFFIGLLDGIGLAMFIPLLQFAGSKSTNVGTQGKGFVNYIINFLQSLDIPVSIHSVLLLMVILFTLKGALNFWQLNKQVRLRLNFIKKIRYSITDDLGQLSFEGFLKLDAGRIQNILSSEVGKLLTAVSNFLNTIKGCIMLLVYISLAALANWNFAILVVAGALLSNLFFKNVYRAINDASINVSKKGNYFSSYLIQAVHYFKYLKATGNFEQYAKKLKTVISDTENLNKKIVFNQSITTTVREPMIILIVSIVITVQLSMGSTLESILLSILLFYRALGSLVGVQTSWQSFTLNTGSISVIDDFVTEVKSLKEIQGEELISAINERIIIRGVNFFYGSKQILHNINIEIVPNETIALVGESGSGKTTLANLITGLIKPSSGNLLVNQNSINRYNLDSYRRRIGYISQEPVIFNDDIYNNVTFWSDRTEANLLKFWEAIEKSSLTYFVKNLEQKELTQLGDHGILVSGGQKQRISIARELFRNIDLLIMDEATSSLDSETEGFIQESMEKLHGTLTIIVIAHRLSTIKNADIIYLLDNGKILAQGKFEKIINSSTKFQRMVALQRI